MLEAGDSANAQHPWPGPGGRRGLCDMTGQDRDWDKTLGMKQTESFRPEQHLEDAGGGFWHRA